MHFVFKSHKSCISQLHYTGYYKIISYVIKNVSPRILRRRVFPVLPLPFISPSRKETLPGTFIPNRYNRRYPSQPCRKYASPGSFELSGVFSLRVILPAEFICFSLFGAPLRSHVQTVSIPPLSAFHGFSVKCKQAAIKNSDKLPPYSLLHSVSLFQSILHSSTRFFSCQG